MKKSLLALAVILAASLSLNAKVELPAILSDGMVLQRNTEVNLWGKAAPGATVSIVTSWNNQKYSTNADASGNWKTKVTTAEAGGPYTITFSDAKKSSTVLSDILLGEVWVCSGQSNMEMPVCGYTCQPVDGSQQAIRDSYLHQNMRIFNVPRHATDTLQTDCNAAWQHPTPENVAACSAIAYFYGRELSDILGIPVGLVTTYWGGTMIEAWMTRKSICEIEGLDTSYLDKLEEGMGTATLYNGMIAPLTNFTAKGFIWYQGESNRVRPFTYASLMKKMIRLWRDSWDNQDMPFICCQLAPYQYDGRDCLVLPVMVEQQYKAIDETPNAYIASSTDMNSEYIIHPSHKRECAERMAGIALEHCYGVKGLAGESPRFDHMSVDGNKVTLFFKDMSPWGELPLRHTCFSWKNSSDEVNIDVKGFEIAGADGIFHPARNVGWLRESKIIIECDEVAEPVAVRYAFRNFTECNVITTDGIPLASFRTDDWEITPEMLFGKK